MHEIFRKFSATVAKMAGSVWAFTTALALVFLWIATGPVFNFSTTWQLVINTLTTIVTFLMVFLIQNTQNRDNKALHLKLDEIQRAMRGARLNIVDVDDFTDEELDQMQAEFKALQGKYQVKATYRRSKGHPYA
ncbi:MAG TPA: low affinity iron permease family protein [Patescibacteria group bacterium]